MKKFAIVLMAVCFTFSSSAFACHNGKPHHKKKPDMSAPAPAPDAAPAN